jgi:DNA-binding LacI/PurR family transcriptional regulator
VVSDVVHDVRLAVKHLLELGHRKIAYIGPKSKSLQIISRRPTFHEVLQKSGITVPETYIFEGVEGEKEDIYQAVHEIMKGPNPPTAFLGAVDIISIYIIDQLARDGFKVPRDISVIGIGNMSVGRYEMISLTTIDEDRFKMGQTAAKIMLDKIENNQLEPQHIFMPGKLIQRNTTANLKKKFNQE